MAALHCEIAYLLLTFVCCWCSSFVQGGSTFSVLTTSTNTYGEDMLAVGTSYQDGSSLFPLIGCVNYNGETYYSGISYIRKVSKDGKVSTIAGQIGTTSNSPDEIITNPSNSYLYSPNSLVIDNTNGDLYFAEVSNLRIRKISSGTMFTIAGFTSSGFKLVSFTRLGQIVLMPNKDIYVACDNQVKIISQQFSTVTDLFSPSLYTPYGLAVLINGDVIFTDQDRRIIVKFQITNQSFTIIGGMDGTSGFQDGSASQSKFGALTFLSLKESTQELMISDTTNQRIRVLNLMTSQVSTLIGGSSVTTLLNYYQTGNQVALYGTQQLSFNSQNNQTYFAQERSVRRVDSITGMSSVIVGSSVSKTVYGGKLSGTVISGGHVKFLNLEKSYIVSSESMLLLIKNETSSLRYNSFESGTELIFDIDKQDNIWFSNQASNYLFKLLKNDTLLNFTISGFTAQNLITTNNENEVVFYDSNKNQLVQLYSNGSISVIGGNGQFPESIGTKENVTAKSVPLLTFRDMTTCPNDSNIYIIESNRIRKISADGIISSVSIPSPYILGSIKCSKYGELIVTTPIALQKWNGTKSITIYGNPDQLVVDNSFDIYSFDISRIDNTIVYTDHVGNHLKKFGCSNPDAELQQDYLTCYPCDNGYMGIKCEIPICFNKTGSSACNGAGQCQSPNNCKCQTGKFGSECEIISLSLNIQKRPLLKSSWIDASYPNVPIENCSALFGEEDLKYLGVDPICKFSLNGLEILLGFGFSIQNSSLFTSRNLNGVQFKFIVLSDSSLCSSLSNLLALDFTQSTTLQNLNSDTILRVSETNVSQSIGRMISWSSSNSDFTPLVSSNQKIVIIPKSYWKSQTIPLTLTTSTSLCGNYSISKTFTFKTDSSSPNIDMMTDTPNGKLNCIGFDCLLEFSISPSGTFKPKISFDQGGDYPTSISSTNLQIARLSNYDDGSYYRITYSGNVILLLPFNNEKQTISLPFNYIAYENSQLFINNLNRYFSKSQVDLNFDFTLQNPLFAMVNPSYYAMKYIWKVMNGNSIIGQSNSDSISIPNPGIGNYTLSLNVKNDDLFSEIIVGQFSVVESVGGLVPDISVQSYSNPIPYVKSLDLTAFINSSSSITQINWNLISGSFYNSPNISNFISNTLSETSGSTSLSIPIEYLKEGSSYTFQITVSNTYGTNIQTLSTTIDYNPRFSCEIFTSFNSSQLLNFFDGKLIVSCSTFESNMAAYVIDFYGGDSKLMTLSNTVKSSVIGRVPYVVGGLSVVVRGINRNGSYRKVTKAVLGSFNVSSNDVSNRVSYISQQWNSLKFENIKMDTASSIFSLLTYVLKGKETFEDFNGMTDSTKQILTSVISEMITTLKSMTTIGYRADDKIAPVILSPTLKLVKFAKSILPTVYNSRISDIQSLTSFIVKGIESMNTYYSQNMVKSLIDPMTFNETLSLVQTVHSSLATSGLLNEFIRLQIQIKPDRSPLNLLSYQSPLEISGKSIQLTNSIKFTFPSNFYSQISSIPFKLVSLQEQSSNSSASSDIISISLFKSDRSKLEIQGLSRNIEISFSDLEIKSENASCVFYDETINQWTTNGIRTTITKKVSGNGYNVNCETNHLTSFSVILNENLIIPVQSIPKTLNSNTTTNTNNNNNGKSTGDITLILVLSIVLPLLCIIVIVIVIIVIIIVISQRKKKKQKGNSHSNEPRQVNDYEQEQQPSLSGYQHSQTHETLQDTELGDFPTDNSMFMKPLMSVYSSSDTGSGTPRFDPMARYKNLEKIGQGGFASVYKVNDSKCGNSIKALKVMKYNSVEELNNILKEGNRLMNISHPYILKVNDVLIDSDQILCIDMDYYEKGDLNQFVKVGSECSEKILKQVLYQMCLALDYVHNSLQIIHRDIKPSNIFIKNMTSDSIHVIIADFGLARQTQGSVMLSYAGTPLFMSTELALGGQYTANTDIYSLGVTLYQMITKDAVTSISHMSLSMDNQEFEKTLRSNMKQSNSSLSDEFIDIIISMLKRDYVNRPYAKDILTTNYLKEFKSSEVVLNSPRPIYDSNIVNLINEN